MFNVAVPTPTEQMFLRTQGQKVSELLDVVTAQLSDPELEKAKRASLQSAENEGIIGPKSIDGWELQDVEDKGNCFYDAVMHQMQFLSINQQNLKIFTFLSSIPEETKPRNSLRLFIQEEQFKDEEWADDKIFDEFVKKFPNIILAIVDTRRPDMGFVYYYLENDSVITNRPDMQIPLPNRDIIKIAATGNHFLSVVSHSDINLQQPVDPTQTKPNISVQSVFEQQTSTLVTLGDLNQLPQSQNVLQAIAKSSTKVPP